MSELTVDDEKVHSVRAWRKGRDGELRVDGRVVQGSSSGILAMLNAEGHIHLGESCSLFSLLSLLARQSQLAPRLAQLKEARWNELSFSFVTLREEMQVAGRTWRS